MSDYAASTFFEVHFAGQGFGMSGEFTSVSGLSIEFEYESYNEGGSNYPRQFFKNVVPQTLVLEQGTVTTVDDFVAWITLINQGAAMTLNGTVMLKDHTGEVKRMWFVQGAFVTKYIGPTLNSLQSELAVTRIELLHNGCY